MPESLSHKDLKSKARQILLSEGFPESKIQIDTYWFTEEISEIKISFRVDVFAKNGSDQVFECGNFPIWKRPYYDKHFGKENIRHLPYPKNYGRHLVKDIEEDKLDSNQAKQFLIDTYKKYIYEEFKNDETYNFLELREDNENLFDLGPHGKYREINPDYGEKEEVIGHKIWMNLPTERTITKDDFRHEIHVGFIYHEKDMFEIVILFTGKEACRKFLNLSKQHHEKVFEELKKLPPGFRIREGFSFWEKSHAPPFDKEWNNPIECYELTKEDYEEILQDQENLMNMGPFKKGPTLDLVKIYVNREDIPEALEKLKPLYNLLIKPHTKIDEIVLEIKELEKDWKWYLNERRLTDLYKNFIEDSDRKIEESEFRKAVKILKKDPEFIKYAGT